MPNQNFLLSLFLLFALTVNSQDSTCTDFSDIDSFEQKTAMLLDELSPFKIESDTSINHAFEEVKKRLIIMNQHTPFNFNTSPENVTYIKEYTERRRRLTKKMLGYSLHYFPIFEEQLIIHKLPVELKYLPIVESALNPGVASRAGAVGLWQFMPLTAKMMGLEISSYVDQRKDPLLSTTAACLYLKKLFTIYEDWNLTLAAYNAGPGNVNKAIRRSGGEKDFWKIRPFLPKETQNYVPTFTAVNYMMEFSNQQIDSTLKVPFIYHQTDTIHTNKIIDFNVVEKWLSYDLEKLIYLNPSFHKGVIPANGKKNTLRLPAFLIADFIHLQDSITNESKITFQQGTLNISVLNSSFYIVKDGDTVWDIAAKYNGISVADIKSLNRNLDISKVKKGDRIVISAH